MKLISLYSVLVTIRNWPYGVVLVLWMGEVHCLQNGTLFLFKLQPSN